MNSALNKNQPELRIFVLPIPLQVLANSNGLLNQMVKILRNPRSQSVSFENPQNFAASYGLHLSDAVRVTENDTDLRRRQSFLPELADVIIHVLR